MSARKDRQVRNAQERREANRKLRIQTEEPQTQTVIDAIYDAFEGANRMQAMSWNDADAADDYGLRKGPPRFPDSESRWEELVESDWWSGSWCYSYLDPKALRYYLPPGMIRNLLGDFDVDPSFVLFSTRDETNGRVNAERWSVLGEDEVEAVRHYLRHFADRLGASDENEKPMHWAIALDAWRRFQPS